MNIKICITGWRRPYYFAQIVKSLEKCMGIENFSFLISVDWCDDKEKQELHKIIFESSSLFKLPHQIYLHNKRKGCAGNVGFAFKTAFEDPSVDAVIMLEDDTQPSEDYLNYVSILLERYKEDEEVFNVSGYCRRVNQKRRISSDHETLEGQGDPNKIIRRNWFTSWGWATWRRIYEEVGPNWFGIHWNNKDGKNGKDVPTGEKFLKYVNKHDTGSWAWPMNRYWRKERKEISPDVSRIQNIGAEEGMFAPGAAWHRNNHYVEIWMGDGNHDVEKDYEYVLTEE